MHAIGDRAVSAVLDGLDRGPARADLPPDRVEHAQLVRAADRSRLAALGVTASVQPIHLPSDRQAAEDCWAGRLQDAYAFGSMAAAGALLAFGSDAPIESANPWLGIHAAVRRTALDEASGPWRPGEALTAEAAANYDATVAAYRQSVLTAFQDVEDNLAALRVLADEAAQQGDAVASAQRSLALANNRYRAGVAAYLEVITAQSTSLANQRSAVEILTRRMTASALLIKALGGGWSVTQLPTQ